MKTKLTDKEISYLAGIIDGEGYIGVCKIVRKTEEKIKRKSNQYRDVLMIANTNLLLMLYLKELIGKIGSFYFGLNKKGGKNKDAYVISCNQQTTHDVLTEVFDDLIVKKEQARLILGFEKRTFFGRKGVPDFEIERREEHYKNVKVLNKRGK